MNLIIRDVTFTNNFTKINMFMTSYHTNKEIIQQWKHHPINIPQVFKFFLLLDEFSFMLVI